MGRFSLTRGTGTQWGLGGGLIASLCCLGPTVAALFGLSGATFLFSMFKYRPYFLVVGAVFMVAGVGLALRRSRQICDATQHRRNQWLFPAVAFLSFGVSYGILTYAAPTLVYRWLEPAAVESQPAQANTNAAIALPAQREEDSPVIAPSNDKEIGNKEDTSVQPDAAALPSEVESTASELGVADTSIAEMAGPRRATLAIQGMT